MTTPATRISRAVLLGLLTCSPILASADTYSSRAPAHHASPADQLFNKGKVLIQQNNVLEGIHWLQQAATQGHATAAYELASLYEAGLGVPKNFQQAKSYYELAIQQGHRNAHYNLALLYNNEQASFRNLQKARELMQTIAQQGDIEAQFVLATLFESESYQATAQPAAAMHWLQSAANRGHGKSQFRLGMYYLRGQYIAKDSQHAFGWFQKAAKQGVAGAQFNLALMYAKGDGTGANPNMALHWYQAAANLGNANAQQNLGIKYLTGEYSPPHQNAGINLITQAATSGLRNAQFLLGQLYQSGYEGKMMVDLGKAEKWYLRAAKQGQSDAQYQLALILLEKKNRANDAKFWIQQAIAAGHQDAIKLQAEL